MHRDRLSVCMLFLLLVLFISVSTMVVLGADQDMKVLRVALTREPDVMDQHATRNIEASLISTHWTESFQMMDPIGNRILGIVEEAREIDPLTIEFHIRDDVYFHNGERMTVEDVAFSLSRVKLEGTMDGETSPNRRYPQTAAESVEIIDDSTIRVVYEGPDIIRHLAYNIFVVYPKDPFEKLGSEEFFKNPIGVGPFRWVEGDLSEYVVMDRFEDYYGGVPEAFPLKEIPAQVPLVDRIIFSFIPESSSRIAALLAGDVDIIQNVPVDQVELLDVNPNIQVASVEGTRVNALEFNVNKAPFDDVRVRHAIAHAIDYETITDILYRGYSTPIYGRPYLEPFDGCPGFTADRVQHLLFDYNPEKARELLAEAGYPDGFTCVFDTVDIFVNEALVIADMLYQVGIEANIRSWELGMIRDTWWEGGRDMALMDIGQGGRSPQGINNRIGTDMHWNFTGYSNPEFDAVWREVLSFAEHTDEREELIMRGYEIYFEDLPQLWIHNPHVIEAAGVQVTNFFAQAHGRHVFHYFGIKD